MKRFLVACRYLLVLPVIGSVILTAGVVIMGMGRIVTEGSYAALAGDFSSKAAKGVALASIEIIELFLVGTVAYITAVGIYKLFLDDGKLELPFRLKIRNLKDLKDKIIGLIVAALAVVFLGEAANGTADAEELLRYGGGIALVVASLALFMSQDSRAEYASRAESAASSTSPP
ncbi:MAG: YqhA family protein [Polyangiales bacterium]